LSAPLAKQADFFKKSPLGGTPLMAFLTVFPDFLSSSAVVGKRQTQVALRQPSAAA
jgi:hypothetical protein